MRLERIEAIDFGRLTDCRIHDLAPGLTVVFGPNESGKSTYAALTRSVLYGFADGRSVDRAYKPDSGSRSARLVFSDDDGSWAVRRVEGAKRGPVAVETLRGAERPDLLAEIVGDVSEQSFRVVFGFGVDELAQIESGNRDGVVARLYAAGSGLDVNPLDIYQDLTTRADSLYAARGRKPVINALAASFKEKKERVRALENEAGGFAEEVARLAVVEAHVTDLKAQRTTVEAAYRRAQLDAQKAAKLEAELDDALNAARTASSAAVVAGERAAAIALDERLLGVSAELDAQLAEAPAIRQRLESAADLAAKAANARREEESLPQAPEALALDPSLRAAIDEWTGRLAAARGQAENAASAARASAAAADGARAAAQQNRTTGVSPVSIVGWVTAALGIVGAAAAGVLGQWVGLVIGIVAGVAGLAVGLLARGQRNDIAHDERARAAAAQAASDSSAAESASAEDARAHAEWGRFAESVGLSAGVTPGSARQLVEVAQRRVELTRRVREFEADRDAALAQVSAWSTRVLELLGLDAGSELARPDRSAELAARGRAELDAAQRAAAQRTELLERAESSRRQAREADARGAMGANALQAMARTHGVDDERPASVLESKAERLAEELHRIDDDVEAAVDERSALQTRINAAGRNTDLARIRQELEGVRGEAAAAADEYLVTAMAARLIEATRASWERDRQPVVIQNSADIFERMTDGRYRDIRVPLDGTGIRVITDSGSSRATDELSRGTAAQLYLALRLGLVSSLGETGRHLPILMDDIVVDFDSDRRVRAARAIAELAAQRQVIFFTCHPEVVDVFAEAVPGTATVALERCSA